MRLGVFVTNKQGSRETKGLSSTSIQWKLEDMLKIRPYQLLLPVLLYLVSCTSHPVIAPEPLKEDETYKGVVLSVENMAPQFVFRKGLGKQVDGGVRIGMFALQGSGVDLTFVLRDEGSRLHTMNFATTYAEQSSFEATYFNVSRKERSKTVRREGKVFKQTEVDIFNYGYLGLRYAYLPTGLWGDKIHLFGLLYGRNFRNNWGVELGYLHNFSGWPQVSEYGFNPRYAPLTGVSLRFWFGLLTKE